MRDRNRYSISIVASAIALVLSGSSLAQTPPGSPGAAPNPRPPATPVHPATSADTMKAPAAAANSTYTARPQEVQAATKHIDEAVRVIHKMNADPSLRQLLAQSKGVLVIPKYGRAALGVGARGGAGVLLVKSGGEWANPSFVNYGGLSIGLQAGAEGGALAFVLNNEKAVNSFLKQDNNWSLNADAGLTIVAWSGKGQASVGKGDVTVWSDTKGLFGDLAISLTDINFDEAETGAYYGRRVTTARDVIRGTYQNPHADALKAALASEASAPTSAIAPAAPPPGPPRETAANPPTPMTSSQPMSPSTSSTASAPSTQNQGAPNAKAMSK